MFSKLGKATFEHHLTLRKHGLLRLKFQPYNKPKNLGIAPEVEIPIIWEEVIFLHFDVSIPGCVGSYKLRWFNLQGNNVAMTKLIVGMVLMLGLQHAKQERPKRCTSVSSGLKTWMILWKMASFCTKEMVVLLQQDSPPPPQMFWQKEVASTYILTRNSQGSWNKTIILGWTLILTLKSPYQKKGWLGWTLYNNYACFDPPRNGWFHQSCYLAICDMCWILLDCAVAIPLLL